MKRLVSQAALSLFLGSLLIFAFDVNAKADCYQQVSRSIDTQTLLTSHNANSMWIEPSVVELNPNEVQLGYKFNITFWANSSLETKGWQMWLTYAKAHINATRAGYTAGGKSEFFQNISTFQISPTYREWNETHNLLAYGEAWVSGSYRSPGYGSLCWIEFEVITFPPEGESVEIPLDIEWAYDLYEPPRTYLYYSDGTYRPLNAHNSRVSVVPSIPIPPAINVLSPENITYTSSLIPLTLTISETTSWIGYCLDNESNVTITGNTTLTGLTTGVHSIVIYANDTFNNMGASAKIQFTVLFVHDIAIINIIVPRLVIPQDCIIMINVTIQNQGDTLETFNVTLIANQTTITSLDNIVLQNGVSTSICFFWNTTGFNNGNYNLSAYATVVLGEADIDDNVYIAGFISINWPYDVTDDNYCGIDDIVSVAEHFGTNAEGQNWNQIYDINCDDYVGIDDIVTIAEHFGEAES